MQCPTCDLAMHVATLCGEALERCGACGGELCSHQALRRLVAAHAPAPGAPAGAYARPSPLSDPVRYRKCPGCGEMMLRKNFHGSSGIVVDVCPADGIWFDRGELGMVFEFSNGDERADGPGFVAGLELIESRNAFDVHQGFRLKDVFLHLTQQVHAAGEESAIGAGQFAGAGGGGGGRVRKWDHKIMLPRVWRLV